MPHVKRKIRDKKFRILEDEFIHMQCATHILILVVFDGLKNLHDGVNKIKNAIRSIKFSLGRLRLFKTCVQSS